MTALSIVIPVFNERGNIGPLVQEVVQHLRGRIPFDIVCVDDQSQDDTRDVLTALKAEVSELRVLVHQRRSGQSTAIRTGVKHALSPWIATLDGDGQNDPADIPKLLAAREQADAQTKLFAGWRVDRKDTASKRWASRWADLPYFDHLHRYLPALMQRAGWKTVSVPVSHRPRGSGQSKYTNLGRALVGIRDLMGVSWLIQRSHVTPVSEIGTGRKP